jgi:hypothetical protein
MIFSGDQLVNPAVALILFPNQLARARHYLAIGPGHIIDVQDLQATLERYAETGVYNWAGAKERGAGATDNSSYTFAWICV